ncbi:unnamed protein product [Cylicocyclus nassatus]|uniref:Uncharacterized protein n=1 Tax=Cylicocyclus nassatus TaxID=53992 RepID=A0AA36M6C9_CYLNA|nr:unnamed protein product [Cylicocyclus nassatus]
MNKQLLSLILVAIAFATVNAAGELWFIELCHDHCEAHPDDYNGKCWIRCIESLEKLYPTSPFIYSLKDLDLVGERENSAPEYPTQEQCNHLCNEGGKCQSRFHSHFHSKGQCVEECLTSRLDEKKKKSFSEKLGNLLSCINPRFMH